MSCNQILLGVKDDMITQKDNTSWKTNKIGGIPDWMPNYALVGNIPQCQLCENKMVLAVQVYCPLGTSPYDRTLYIFCCIKQACWNKHESWQAYRIQHLPNEQNIKEEVFHTEDTWLSEELDWDDDSSNNTPDTTINPDIPECDIVIGQSIPTDSTDTKSASITDDCSPLTMKLLDMNRATTKNLPWQTSQKLLVPPDYSPIFEPFFISVIEEPQAKKVNSDEHIQQLLNSYQGKEFHTESQNMNIASGAEMYEKYCVKHGDRIFQKFVNRVARCQEQVIRYSWKGEPLLMRKETLPLTCQYCHGPMVYELQLMPALVSFLRLQDIKSEDVAVEFGTVFIFTCQNSCWEEDSEFKIENVCVQSDPDEDLFQQRT